MPSVTLSDSDETGSPEEYSDAESEEIRSERRERPHPQVRPRASPSPELRAPTPTPVPHDVPLPTPRSRGFKFSRANYPRRDPVEGDMVDEEDGEMEKDEAKVEMEHEWVWSWSMETLLPGKEKVKPARDFAWQSAAFFPFFNLPQYNSLEGIFAIVGGGQVQLFHVLDKPPFANDSPVPDDSTGSRIILDHLASFQSLLDHNDPDLGEEFCTCAWSLNTSSRPHIPFLAVAGRSGVINILQLLNTAQGKLAQTDVSKLTTYLGPQVFDQVLAPPRFRLGGSHDPALGPDCRRRIGRSGCAAAEGAGGKVGKEEGGEGKEGRLVRGGEAACEGRAEGDARGGRARSGGVVHRYSSYTPSPRFRRPRRSHQNLVPRLPLPLNFPDAADPRFTTLLNTLPPRRPLALSDPLGLPFLDPPPLQSAFVGPDKIPRTIVRLWRPDGLQEIVSGAKEPNAEGFGAKEGMEKVELGRELGFLELGRFEMKEQEFVGDTVGLHRGVRGQETFVAVPSKKGLRLFRPYALPEVGGGTEAERKQKLVEALFPPERERPRGNFVPALRSERVLESAGKHWRCVVVQPEGGKWMVAVGDGLSVGIWRRRRRMEGSVESEGSGDSAMEVEAMLAPASGSKLSFR